MSSREPAAENRGAPVGTILLLIVAVVFYAAMMGSLSGASHTDAAGRGLAVAFGALFATILFVDLAALLIVAAVKGCRSPAR
jgi:cytochrome c oxidase assembly factor CtaG